VAAIAAGLEVRPPPVSRCGHRRSRGAATAGPEVRPPPVPRWRPSPSVPRWPLSCWDRGGRPELLGPRCRDVIPDPCVAFGVQLDRLYGRCRRPWGRLGPVVHRRGALSHLRVALERRMPHFLRSLCADSSASSVPARLTPGCVGPSVHDDPACAPAAAGQPGLGHRRPPPQWVSPASAIAGPRRSGSVRPRPSPAPAAVGQPRLGRANPNPRLRPASRTGLAFGLPAGPGLA